MSRAHETLFTAQLANFPVWEWDCLLHLVLPPGRLDDKLTTFTPAAEIYTSATRDKSLAGPGAKTKYPARDLAGNHLNTAEQLL